MDRDATTAIKHAAGVLAAVVAALGCGGSITWKDSPGAAGGGGGAGGGSPAACCPV